MNSAAASRPPAWWPSRLQAADTPPAARTDRCILIDADAQVLWTFNAAQVLRAYPVSTSRHGLGCARDSYQTPVGWHRIEQRIGAGAPPGMVFKGRIEQGWTSAGLSPRERLAQDLITSRILWLRGLQPGCNAGPGCDSYERYIYIHGTAADELVGRPASIGCVRMLDADVIELFDWALESTPVYIGGRAQAAST